MPHHIFDTERRHIAGPVFFQQLPVGHSLQKFLIGQVFSAHRLKIQLGLFAGCPVFSDVQFINIIVDLLGRFLEQLLPFFQQLRHPHVELSDHRSDSQNDQQDHHRNQNYRFQHLFIQLGQ